MRAKPIWTAGLAVTLMIGGCSGSGGSAPASGGAPVGTPAPAPTPTPAPSPTPTPTAAVTLGSETYLGPQTGWANLRTTYGARGDGTTDDSAALQRAFDELGTSGRPATLFVPAGRYRITTTISLTRKDSVTIIGEDPATTSIDWAGPANSGSDTTSNTGVMLLGQGSSGIRIGRLTFNGNGRANYGIRWRWAGYSSGDLFPSGMQHYDLVFQDMEIGIGAGCGRCTQQDTAEYSHVYRTQFLRCSYAGLQMDDFNSLLWGVIDSYFEDNGTGVLIGAGNANVYDSTFVRSRTADVGAFLATFVGARGNISSGSRHFFASNGNTGTATLQNNVVLDPTAAAVDVTDGRLITIIGNRFRTGSAIAVENRNATVLSAGNQFSDSVGITRATYTLLRSLDDQFGVSVNATVPGRPVAPTAFAGQVFTPAALTGTAIQSAIDQAAAVDNALVYLPAGTYNVGQTITVPAGRAIRIVGDGTQRTILISSNPAVATPVMQLRGPSRASLQDLTFHGGYNTTPTADELLISGADQVGGAVIAYGISVTGPNTSNYGVVVDGVDNSNVELILPHYFGGRAGALLVRGGTSAASLANAAPNVRMVDGFAGVGGANGTATYRIENGGRLMTLEQWAETTISPFASIVDRGNLTVSGGNFGYSAPSRQFIAALGFSGRMSLIGALFGSADVSASGSNAAQNVLIAASRLDGWQQGSGAASVFTNTTTAGFARQYLNYGASYGPDERPNATNAEVSDTALRLMLSDLRGDASRRNALSGSASVTAVQLRRLRFESGNNGLRITAQ